MTRPVADGPLHSATVDACSTDDMRSHSTLYRVVEVCRAGRSHLRKVHSFYHPDLARIRHHAEFVARHSTALRVYISDDQGRVIDTLPPPPAG